MRSLLQEMNSPERGLVKIAPSFWFALGGAFLFGLITHGMVLFNKLSWHDDIFSLFMTGTAIPLGRWMLYVFAELERWFYGNGYFSLPVVNGVISLLCIGLSAGLIVNHFQIRSRMLSVLLGAVMAVFPVVTSLFGFMFTIHYYMVALLMIMAGSVLICSEGWWKKAAGMLLGGCAVGVYQAFIPVMLMMVLLDQIMFLVRKDEKTGIWARRLLIQTLCIAGVMAVYFAGNDYFLRTRDLKLDDFLGINEIEGASMGQYPERAGLAYREFFHLTHNTLWDMYPQALYNIYRMMLCLDLMLGICWMIRVWKKSPFRALMLGLMLALVPLGCNFAFVMSEEVHSLMVYGQVMQMVLLVCLVDWPERPLPSLHRVISMVTALLLICGNIMYFRYDNQCYLKVTFQQQEAISWNTTLVTRIESTEGFRDELPVAFVNRENMEDRNLCNLDEFDFLTLGTYDANIREYLNDWAWEQFMARWCGFSPKMVKLEQVQDWPEVQAMPSYPDDGSIQVIRDVVVVKF